MNKFKDKVTILKFLTCANLHMIEKLNKFILSYLTAFLKYFWNKFNKLNQL